MSPKAIPKSVLGLLLDRYWEAIFSGRIEVQWGDTRTEGKVCLTEGELVLELNILVPEYHLDRLPEPDPTTAPPGTMRKIDEMRRRAKAGLSLFSPGDADAAGGIAHNRRNGTGLKMEEKEEPC